MSDIYPIPGRPFVHAYPITHHQTATGLWYILNGRYALNAEPDDPLWPPSAEPTWWQGHYENPSPGLFLVVTDVDGKEMSLAYNVDREDVPQTGIEFYWGGEDGRQPSGDLPISIYDRWGGGSIQLYRRHNSNTVNDDNRQTKMAVDAQYMTRFDLRGINAASIQRAELVMGMGGTIFIPPEGNTSEPWNRVPQSLIVRIENTPVHNHGGFAPGWEDLVAMTPGSHIPPIDSHQIINWSSGTETNPYKDLYQHPDFEWNGRSAFPINAAGLAALRHGGVVRVRAGFDTSVVPDYGDFSNIFVEDEYDYWFEDGNQNDVTERGSMLTCLRLWMGGAEAEMTLGLRIEARPRIDDPKRVLSHRARQRRGW